MSKRILSLVLALVMVLGTFGTVFAADTVQKDAAEFLAEAKVLLGDDKGNLNLDLKLERRDMVILLSRLMGDEEVASKFPVSEESPTWEDARTDAYYVPFFAWAQVNKFFAGKTVKEFGPREAITAQDYAVVLLRALGYDVEGHDAWKAALADAKKLGILANVEVEDATEITRGQMSVMTLNALAVNVKDSTKTLAETLEIKLPVPAVLEAEVVADNLKEIKVVFNKDVDADLLNLELYSTTAGEIEHAVIEDGNVVVLTLKGNMTKKAYSLTIKGTKEVDGKYNFTAGDNAIPAVESVVGLGTKALKVTMTEPIKDTKKVSNFTIDGKAVYGSVNVIGREIIIKTYNALSVGEHDLTVSSLEDYAGFKSLATTVTFEVVEDKEAPTVVEVEAPALEKVIVTFSEEVDAATVNNKTIYHGNKVYPTSHKALTGNKYEFTFEGSKGLPLHETTIYVSGVADYSGNKMVAAEVAVKAVVDLTRPEVEEVTLSADRKVVTVKFTKNVELKDAKFTILDKKDNKLIIVNTEKLAKSAKLTLGKALTLDGEYTLKITDVKDTNKYANYMADYSELISVSDVGQPNLALAEKTLDPGKKDEDAVYTLTLSFDKAMDFSTVSDPANYLVEVDGVIKPLSTLSNSIDILDSDGRKVEVKIYAEKDSKGKYIDVTGIAGLELKAANGKTISNYGKMEYFASEVFKNTKAVATAKDKVKVTFNQVVVNDKLDADVFTLTDGTKTYEIDDVAISGKNVTLTLKDKVELPADTKDVRLKIAENEIKGYGNVELEETILTLKDELAPSIVKDGVSGVATSNKVVLTVKFDEDLFNFSNAPELVNILKSDIEVVRHENTGVVDVESITLDGKTLTIEILAEEVGVDVEETNFTVRVLGTGLVRDNHGNAQKSEGITVKVVEIK